MGMSVCLAGQLTGDTIFMSPTGGVNVIMWSSEPRKGLVICKAMAVPSILSYF